MIRASLAFHRRANALILCIGFSLAVAGCSIPAPVLPRSARGTMDPGASETKAVKVITERDGESTRFYVENNELCEITMTFDMALVNLETTGPFPLTATFPAGAKTLAFTVVPSVEGAKWEYSYTNYFKLGSNGARHDDSYFYELPYAAGKAFRVTQAYGGTFSHKGSNKHAIDWKMPEGTAVHAARGGLVVKTKDDSTKGGSSLKYDCYNNYVLIRHDDGTLGHYCHLLHDGIQVKPGDTVEAGQKIALSGNTGFSTGPHLHFCVFKTKNGRDRQSIPVKFRTAETKGITLVEGKTYKAAASQASIAKIDAAEPRPQGASVE